MRMFVFRHIKHNKESVSLHRPPMECHKENAYKTPQQRTSYQIP